MRIKLNVYLSCVAHDRNYCRPDSVLIAQTIHGNMMMVKNVYQISVLTMRSSKLMAHVLSVPKATKNLILSHAP